MATFRRVTIGLVCLLASCAGAKSLFADPIFSSDYETDPNLMSAYLATWTTAQAHSGTHSIYLPALPAGTVWYNGPRYYVTQLPDAGSGILKFTYWTMGGSAYTQDAATIPYSQGWTQHVNFLRPTAGTGYNFCVLPIGATYLDDMTVEWSTPKEFTTVRHADVAALGGTVRLNQASMTQNRLPNTFNALKTGRPLRIVMLGDSIMNDSYTSAWDLYVKNHYANAQITLIDSVRGSTGMDWYAQTETTGANAGTPRINTWVLDYQPDLVIIGGISTQSSEYFRDVIDQIKAGSNAEILITTGAAGDVPHHNGDARQDPDWSFELGPTTTTGSSPNTLQYREELAQIAADENVGFLDTRGSWGDFTTQMGGLPYSTLQRDSIHMNDLGTAVAGQAYEAYFDAAIANPEPATLAVLGMGLSALLVRRRR
jgi:hypothetical protein